MRHRDCHGLGRDRALFRFSDTWQLVINTGTTIVTFLMVFLIQNTQNRDSAAIQLKLDELIRSTKGAHNALLDLGQLSQEDLDRIRCLYEKLPRDARRNKKNGVRDIKQRRSYPKIRRLYLIFSGGVPDEI